MFTFRRVILCLMLSLVGCSRSPQVYVEMGNKFAAEHKYKDASIQYRKALQKNPNFGEAAYRLALSELEQHNAREGYRLLERAVELMPDNQEAKVKLADLALSIYWTDSRRPKAPYQKMVKLADDLLAKNPNSFDGLRFKGAQAMLDRQPKLAVEYFSKANAIKPMQAGLVLEFVQALMTEGRGPEAERLALELISRERAYGPIYDILYQYYARQNRVADAEELLKKKVDNMPEDAESRLELARHYARTRKPDQMKATLQGLVGDSKTFPKGRLQVADFYSKIRDWQHALELFEEGARLNSNPLDKLSYEKGVVNALMALGKREDASKRIDSLAKQNPTDDEVKAVQASIWLLSRQPTQVTAAIAQLEDLTKRKPDDLRLRYDLAQAYRSIQNWESARAQFQEMLKRRGGNVESRLGLAELGLAQNRPAETLRYADEVLAGAGENPRARLLRAAALTSMRNYTQAHQELNRILRASPQDRNAQIQAGVLAIEEKQYKEAEKIFTKLQQGGVEDIRSLTGLVNAYAAENQHDRAIEVINEALKRSPDSAELRRLLASAAIGARRYDIALDQYGKLLTLTPNSPQLYMDMGRVRVLKADFPGAIAHFEKAKQLLPKHPDPPFMLASVFHKTGRLEEAKANFQQVLQLQPDNADAQNNLAYLLAETGGNLDEALKLAQQAQQKHPSILSFADTLGWVYLKKNIPESALQVFEGIVRKSPDVAVFRYHLAMALVAKGDKQRARRELELALTKKPDSQDEVKIRQLLAGLG